MTEPDYEFRPLTADDLSLLNRWLQIEHVARWWDAADPFDADDLAEGSVAMRLVRHRGVPIAYMQDYDVHAEPDHHFANLPLGSRGIDQFIGPPEMLGIGHGSRFIACRICALFAVGAPALGVDPHPDNARAIHVYDRLGFRVSGPARETPWGRILPMVRLAG